MDLRVLRIARRSARARCRAPARTAAPPARSCRAALRAPRSHRSRWRTRAGRRCPPAGCGPGAQLECGRSRSMTDSATHQPIHVSFEFFPPADAAMEATLWASLDRLAPLAPRFVSVTYGADGSTRERTHNVV